MLNELTGEAITVVNFLPAPYSGGTSVGGGGIICPGTSFGREMIFIYSIGTSCSVMLHVARLMEPVVVLIRDDIDNSFITN